MSKNPDGLRCPRCGFVWFNLMPDWRMEPGPCEKCSIDLRPRQLTEKAVMVPERIMEWVRTVLEQDGSAISELADIYAVDGDDIEGGGHVVCRGLDRNTALREALTDLENQR